MSLLGDALGFVGGVLGVEGSKDVNSAQLAAMGGNQQFLQYNSDTAYQRAVRDMQIAGLNPMLAYSQGGASTPGAPAVPKLENVGLAGVQGAASGVQIASVLQGLEKQSAETENIKADTALKQETLPKVQADARVSQETIDLVRNQAIKVASEDRNLYYEMRILQNRIPQTQYAAIREKYETLLTMFDYKNLAPEKARIMRAEAQLLELEVPKALNEAAAQDTAFKRYVSPFLGDVGKLTGSALDASRARYLGQGLRRR